MPSGMNRTAVSPSLLSASLALALALVAGCGSKTPEPTQPAPEPTPDPVVADPVPVVPEPEDPELVRQRKVDAALARIPAIKAGLSALRALPFKEDVPAQYQSNADFRAFVTGEVNETFTPDKAGAISDAMFHIGLLAERIDLAQTLGDAFVSQAAAYYDPKQKKFFVVLVPEEQIALDTMSAHELTHALQDQHFGLDAYLEPKTPLNEDETAARKFVVEGEATLTMFAYAGQTMGGDLLGKGLPLLKLGLGQAAAMSIDDFKAMTKQQQAGAAGLDSEMQKSLDAMDTIPPAIMVPMLDSYMKGALAVLTAFEQGGWAEVATLYANPPQSTEQMLHPATKLYPTRDLPKKVTLPATPGLTEIYGNTIGELEWRVYFMLWNKAVADKAADGWDGDHWSVRKAADGSLVGLVVTTWDSPAEATEFATAYEQTIATRFPNKERTVWTRTKGANVYIVDGGTDAKLIDKLVKGAKIK